MSALEILRPAWPAPAGVCAASTTRQLDGAGVSQPPYHSFNLALHVGDDPAAVQVNRDRLRQGLDLPAEPQWLEQVHGNAVLRLAGNLPSSLEADAAITRLPGQVCAVMTADCLPVLFCDRAGTQVAAAHAGWRGLAAGVLEATVAAFDTDPAQLLAWLGPAIGPRAFEVGDEVRQQFVSQDSAAARAFVMAPGSADGSHWLADLYLLASQHLQRAGVRAIYGGGECTYTDKERFFSYRRDRQTGRMASLIWLAGN